MVNPRQKGKNGEEKLIKDLKELTGIDFSRTPGSGSGKVKGDITAPGCIFCIEVKNYKEDPLSSTILCNKTSLIPVWWEKLKLQSKGKKPLLVYRWNRSKWFVVTEDKPSTVKKFIDIPDLSCYIMLLDDWINYEEIRWLRSTSS